jgi:cell division protein FtsB
MRPGYRLRMSTERLRRLRAAIAQYEREYGEITAEEIAAQRRSDRHGHSG